MTKSKEYKVMNFLLEESTFALDVHGQQRLRKRMEPMLSEQDVALLLRVHSLTEIEHRRADPNISNHGQVVARDAAEEVMSQVRRNNLQNCMRIQVPPAAVLETRQILDGMPNILKLTRINELGGWLEIELLPASNSNSVNAYQGNRILSALIRAKIPIISFAPEDGRIQDTSLSLAREANP